MEAGSSKPGQELDKITLLKTESDTDEEFEAKYKVFEKILGNLHSYGRGGQFSAMFLLIAYCMKGKRPMRKIFAGGLYIYWSQHFYHLSSYLGIIVNLPWALEELDLGPGFQTTKNLRLFLSHIREREQARQAGTPTLSDGELMKTFYKETEKNSNVTKDVSSDKIYKRSYVANNFFEKNYEKFAKDQSDPGKNNEIHRVFEPMGLRNNEDSLKLPYLDSFLTRYVYHSFRRWGRRVGQYAGLIKDE